MRILCDTNILVRANPYSGGAARELLRVIRAQQHTLVVSESLLDELEVTLSYPRLQRLWPAPPKKIREFRLALEGLSEKVEPAQGPRIVAEDPDDDVVVYTAVAAQADVICSLDRHLHSTDVRDYCQRHGIRIVRDDELLRELKAESE